MDLPGIGHNTQGQLVNVEVRLFNSMTKYSCDRNHVKKLTLAAGAGISDILQTLKIPADKVFLVLVNGKDVTPGRVGDPIRENYILDDGDVVALSGPVPYSFGYGAPIV